MAQMPTGEANREFNEVSVLISHYGRKLTEGGSYGDMLRTIDRLVELRDKAKKLWGDR